MRSSRVSLSGVSCNSSVLKVFAMLLWVCPMHAQLRSEPGISAGSYTELMDSLLQLTLWFFLHFPAFGGTFSQTSGQKYGVPWSFSPYTAYSSSARDSSDRSSAAVPHTPLLVICEECYMHWFDGSFPCWQSVGNLSVHFQLKEISNYLVTTWKEATHFSS